MKVVTVEMTEDVADSLTGAFLIRKGQRANACKVKEGNEWYYRILSEGRTKDWLLSPNCVKEVQVNPISHGRRKVKIRSRVEN